MRNRIHAAISNFLWNRYWAAPLDSLRESFWYALHRRFG